MERWRSEYVQLAWWAFGALLVAVVAFAVYSLIGAVVFGVFLYYAVRPIYERLEPYVDSANWRATATMLLVGLPMVLVAAYGVLQGVRELNQFLATHNLQGYRSLLQPYLGFVQAVTPRGSEFQTGTAGPLRSLGIYAQELRRYAARVFGILVKLFVMLLVAFYLLVRGDETAYWFRNTFDDEHSMIAFMEAVDDDLEHIYWGNLVTVFATALIAGVVYYGLDVVSPPSIGVPYPILGAALTGIFTLIPVIGIKLFYVPASAYLFYAAYTDPQAPMWFPVLFLAVVVVVVDTIPDWLIRSWISAGNGIHMGLVLISYVFGSIAFGWYGIFLGPIILVLFVHFAREILPLLLSNVPVESTAD